MAHLQYMPGDPRLVDQLVYELKSKGIFDKFRKECIADVDTRPAYQNLRQRVENSVSTFLSRQCWKPELNKNQLREKLRKHILDGNYLEQGVERIVDQVVNPKVASVFIPQVEDLVYNYLGITRKKTVNTAETSNGPSDDLLPTDLEAVSPGSVKSNDDKNEIIDVEMTDDVEDTKMEIDETNGEVKEENPLTFEIDKEKTDQDTRLSGITELIMNDSDTNNDKSIIPLPSQDISLDNIPAPDNSPPKQSLDLETIQLPREPNLSTDIPLPDEVPKAEKDQFFKPVNSDDDDSSSDSSLRRNMSPLTPIRNFNNENSCDAQQAFENDSDSKNDEKKEPSTFRFTIETKGDNNTDDAKIEKKDTEQTELTFQFNSQVNITFNTPMYEDSSNSNNLHIDYESDVNSKINTESKLPEGENSEDCKKDKKIEDKKSSQKISHKSRDSSRHATSKEKRPDSKRSSRDSSRHDRKSSKDESKSKSSNKERERSRDRSEKKDSRDSSRHRSSHKSSSNRDSKSSSHRSSSSSQRHTSKHSDDKKSSSKEKSTDSSKNKDKSKDSKSLHRSDKDQKDRKSKKDDKDKKKDKKDTDDHYSLSGRGNHTRRSTDRDSNDGSSSSKGSSNPSNAKATETKKENKGSSKSDNTSPCGESTSPSDREHIVNATNPDVVAQARPIVRVETHLEVPIAAPPRLPFVPDVTLKKPKFAANFEEAKRLMKMRKFLDEEQKRMNQEAALLLEFQANVRPSLSQVYSSIPGPELEFACVTNSVETAMESQPSYEIAIEPANIESRQMTVQEIENIIGVNITGDISDTMYIEDDLVDKSANVGDNCHNSPVQDIENCQTTVNKLVDVKCQELTAPENITEEEGKIKDRYNDNNDKPFSDIIDEITKYKNASDSKTHVDKDDSNMEKLHDDENKKRTEFFEVTIITEELTETEDVDKEKSSVVKSEHIEKNTTPSSPANEVSDSDKLKPELHNQKIHDENVFEYFGETEKYNAELERDRFGTFLKKYIENTETSKMYLINCDTYEENIMKEVSDSMGRYEIICYHKNGHLNLTNIVKNVNLVEEISLPVESPGNDQSPKHTMLFSPVKSDCSFELSNEYDAKLREMVNKTSRKEVMEIILGSVIDESPSEMPKIDYCSESSIESGDLKRKCEETIMNNNTQVLTPNKIRRLSESDQISSTTEEMEEVSNVNRLQIQSSARSKYLGRARRVGLPKPKKSILPNSPSSDKSVENYEQNAPTTQTPNGKLKSTQRITIQRYDTSDLYKPKLHYLSRRNNIS